MFAEENKEEIIKEFMPLIKYTALRLSWRLPPALTEEDLISAGVVGLLEALERYDPTVAKLNTFVEYRIKGAMLDLIEKNQFLPKSVNKKIFEVKRVINELEKELGRMPEDEEIAKRCGITLDEYYQICDWAGKSKVLSFNVVNKDDEDLDIAAFIADREDYTPPLLIEKTQLVEKLTEAIGQLSEKEQIVLNLYYNDELTMKEIAQILGVTEGRVCQIHNQAILKLRSKLSE